MLLRTIYEIIQMNRIVNFKGRSAMRAQVATFSGCLIPSQFARPQATKINIILHARKCVLCRIHLVKVSDTFWLAESQVFCRAGVTAQWYPFKFLLL
jgi:hypothetical protein